MADDVLQMPLQYLKGVGPRKAADLKKAGLNTVEDLLFRFPRRYEDRSRMQTIISLRPGMTAAISGTVLNAGLAHTRRPGFRAVLGAGAGRQRADPGGVAEPGVPQGRHQVATAHRAVRQGRDLGIARPADHRSRIRDRQGARPGTGNREPGTGRSATAHRPNRSGLRAHRQRDHEHAAPLRLAGARSSCPTTDSIRCPTTS